MNATLIKPRGFAAMDLQTRLEMCRLGGITAHRKGTAHEFTSEEARAAGKKEGLIISRDRERMARIGRIGGTRSAAAKRERAMV